jgi:hypothetical protein
MKVDKKRALLKKISKEDDSFVKASPEELVSFMWELTSELWSLKGSIYVERRLQRDIAVLIKQ